MKRLKIQKTILQTNVANTCKYEVWEWCRCFKRSAKLSHCGIPSAEERERKIDTSKEARQSLARAEF